MPSVRKYNSGSIVYFQEDKGEEIFVLQQGSIILISTGIETQQEKREQVKIGEFFGVKSALGRYPREETAQAKNPSTLVVFKQEEFEKYMLRNTRLIVKMMQVFSNELRTIHRRLRSVLKVDKEKNPAFELLSIAESFYKTHNLDHASYAFGCYLKYYPGGKNRKRVDELLDMIKQKKTYPSAYSPPESEGDAPMVLGQATQQKKHGKNAEAVKESAILSLFDSAEKAMARGETVKAVTFLQECVIENKPKTKDERNIYERAEFELGVTLMKIKKYTESAAYFSKYIKSYPTGEHIRDSIFQLGIIQEMQTNKKQASILYHKVATMQPHDDITTQARSRLQQLSQN